MTISQTTTTRYSSRLRLGAVKNEDDMNDDDDVVRSGNGAEDEVDNDGIPVTSRRSKRIKVESDNNSNSTAQTPVRTTRSSCSRIISTIITPPGTLDAGKSSNNVKKRRALSLPTIRKTTGAAAAASGAAKRQTTTVTSNVNTATTTASSEATALPQTNVHAKAAAAVMSPPKGWENIYSLVVELRQDRTAPCDISGCEALAMEGGDESGNSGATTSSSTTIISPQEFRLRTLIALMLSSQTKDAIVGEAVRNMIQDDVLTVAALRKMSPDRLCNHYLAKVGFRNNKTRFIKETVEILHDKYNDDIPPTAALMIAELPGVGPKMAYICESVAWNIQSGIGVDTHMHRIFTLLHWVKQPCKTPEQTRQQLETWLPHEYWADVNLLWVGFGQEVQQEKPKLLRKALNCSRPVEALHLLKRCGLDYNKEAQKLNLQDQVQQALTKK